MLSYLVINYKYKLYFVTIYSKLRYREILCRLNNGYKYHLFDLFKNIYNPPRV